RAAIARLPSAWDRSATAPVEKCRGGCRIVLPPFVLEAFPQEAGKPAMEELMETATNQSVGEQSSAQQEAAPVKGGIVAYLQIDGAMKAAEFYKQAFGAVLAGAHPPDEQGRTMHVHVYINGSSLMLSDAYPDYGYPL